MTSSTNHDPVKIARIEDYKDQELEELRRTLSAKAMGIVLGRSVKEDLETFMELRRHNLIREQGRIWWLSLKASALSQYVRRYENEVASIPPRHFAGRFMETVTRWTSIFRRSSSSIVKRSKLWFARPSRPR